jgi:hypothetical protein
MPVKPTDNEEEYFARHEAEKRRKLVAERQKRLAAEERERARDLHHMKCPKCGAQLEELAFANIHVDKCFACEGMWLDKGELEALQAKGSGFMGRLLNVFR